MTSGQHANMETALTEHIEKYSRPDTAQTGAVVPDAVRGRSSAR
jgi:hypothetical protein